MQPNQFQKHKKTLRSHTKEKSLFSISRQTTYQRSAQKHTVEQWHRSCCSNIVSYLQLLLLRCHGIRSGAILSSVLVKIGKVLYRNVAGKLLSGNITKNRKVVKKIDDNRISLPNNFKATFHTIPEVRSTQLTLSVIHAGLSTLSNLICMYIYGISNYNY